METQVTPEPVVPPAPEPAAPVQDQEEENKAVVEKEPASMTGDDAKPVAESEATKVDDSKPEPTGENKRVENESE